MNYALEIEGLTKSFGDKIVVNDVSFNTAQAKLLPFEPHSESCALILA
jgi:ABC-type uncharacterized transport system ATPase subunit